MLCSSSSSTSPSGYSQLRSQSPNSPIPRSTSIRPYRPRSASPGTRSSSEPFLGGMLRQRSGLRRQVSHLRAVSPKMHMKLDHPGSSKRRSRSADCEWSKSGIRNALSSGREPTDRRTHDVSATARESRMGGEQKDEQKECKAMLFDTVSSCLNYSNLI